MVDYQQVGSQGEHLRLKLRQDNAMWNGIAFDLGSSLNELAPYLDIVYNPTLNRWSGEEALQLNILDFRPTSAKAF